MKLMMMVLLILGVLAVPKAFATDDDDEASEQDYCETVSANVVNKEFGVDDGKEGKSLRRRATTSRSAR
ncbi:MAG: hypothetical protein AB1540_13865 [Bdellovibrionota bacterium]